VLFPDRFERPKVLFHDVTDVRDKLVPLAFELLHVLLEYFKLALGIDSQLVRLQGRFQDDLFSLFFGAPDPILTDLLDSRESLLELILALLHTLQFLILSRQGIAQAGVFADQVLHVASHQLEKFVDFPRV
jgi:hypothetical protein